MRRLKKILIALALLALVLVGGLALAYPLLIPRVAGAWEHAPAELATGLSAEARQLLDECLEGVDPERRHDYHVHCVGVGAGGSGCWVNPRMRSRWRPVDRVRFDVYLHASGVEDLERADAQYVERLLDLIRNAPNAGTYGLLAFDHLYDSAGQKDLEHSEFHTPNDYVLRLAEEHPEAFEPVASVHPYRPDALDELERVAEAGAQVVKWLPNAMGIDPASAACDAYYAKMVELDLTLLTHAGEEKAVHAEELQKLGNPLRLRRALDAGVRVVIAHCAGLGLGEDLDDPARPLVPNFDLFLRLMDEERYEGLLFGEISAVTQINRYPDILKTLLERQDLHPRLVNGSDYPLPAINALFHTRALERDGFLTATDRDLLNEIYSYNPLLYDFALKRRLVHPDKDARFPPSVFERLPDGG